MSSGTFGTAINCMDGRTQRPVIDLVMKRFGVDYVDMITEPGPVRIISEQMDLATVQSIRHRLQISMSKHRSKGVAVVGHYDCAANPTDVSVQLRQIMDSAELVRSWGFDKDVVGLWIDEHWTAHTI